MGKKIVGKFQKHFISLNSVNASLKQKGNTILNAKK
jgi:hypothetical protein